MAETGIPLACTLDTPAARRAQAERLGALVRSAERRHTTERGVRLGFEPRDGLLAELAAVLDIERTCCRFLEFHITVTRDSGRVWLDVEGPPEAREVIEAIWIADPRI